MPATTRTFRVFVSSTFDDLVDERNVLQEKVFAKLEKFCLEKGTKFQAVDLRWGVREEAGLDQKTMEICLAEIARCQKTRIKPNFIVLLGSRYGWRPLPARIQKDEFEAVLNHVGDISERDFGASWYDLDLNADPPEYLLKPRKGIFTDWDKWEPVEERIHRALREGAGAAGLSSRALVKYEASATHQEILNGLGETAEDRAHVFAFLRLSAQDEDPDLTKLKDHLKTLLPEGNIFPWSVGDHDRLCDDVERSLKAVIAATADRVEAQSEKASHDRFAEDRVNHFKGRGAVLDAIGQYLQGDDRRPLVVHGPSGSGKSAIMAVASESRSAIRRFIGATPESSSGTTLLRSLCRELGERFGQTGDLPATFDELSAMFSERLQLATAEQPVILFIDALDQLNAQDPAAAIRWLPAELPPHCHVVLSTTEIPAALRRSAVVPVEPLPVEDAELALDSWFTEARRTLQPEQREKLLTSFLQSGLPLYLKLAFEEARLWRSFDPPGLCVLGDGLPGIVDRLFARLSDPANHGRILVGHALGYLTAARYGLTEDEILAVLTKDDVVWKDVVGEGERRRHNPPLRQLPVIVWSRLHMDLEPYLTERRVPGGTTVSFYHRQLAERVETTALHHAALVSHFAGQSHWLGTNVPNQRKLTELVQQQAGSGLPDDAATMLTDLDFVSAKCAAELVFDLEEDYRETIATLPEAQEERREEERRQAELARWTQTLIECREQKRSPKPEEIIKSVEPWSHERIATESQRIAEHPDRLDRLRAFGAFVKSECYPLLNFGAHEGFVIQHASNRLPGDPVQGAGYKLLKSSSTFAILRKWPSDARYIAKPACIRTLEGHSSSVASVSITPDGRCAVSVSSIDQTLRLWDLESGQCLRTLNQGTCTFVHSVSVTPDGRRAVCGGWDKTLRVWDLESGQCLRMLEGHGERVNSVSITPDGRLAVSGGWDNTLRVWDLESGQCLRTLEGHSNAVWGTSVTPDGRRAVSASSDFTLRVWDLESGQCLGVLKGHIFDVGSVSVTADGRRAVSGGIDQIVRVWDLENGECLRMLKGHSGWINSVSVTPDGRWAVSADNNKTLRVWDLESGQCLRTLEGHSEAVTSVTITADGRRAVSASEDETLRVWDLESGQSMRTAEGHSDVTADGQRSVSGSDDKTSWVWKLETGQSTRTLEGHDEEVNSVSVTADGRLGTSASVDATLRLWDPGSCRCLRTLEGHSNSVNSVSVTADGRLVVSASNDKTLRVWDLDSGQCLWTLEGHSEMVMSVSVTPDARRAVSASMDHTLRVWDLEGGQCLRTLEGHSEMVNSVSFTPDGRRAVSASSVELRVWDLESGQCVRTVKGLGRSVNSVCVAPDGQRVVCGGWNETLRVWDLDSGKCLRTLEGHTEQVNSVSVTPDGRRAVSASDDKTLRVWDLESGQCLGIFVGSACVKAAALGSAGRSIMIGTTAGEVVFCEQFGRNLEATAMDTTDGIPTEPSCRNVSNADHEARLRRSLTSCCRYRGDHPDTIGHLTALIANLKTQGRLSEAESMMRERDAVATRLRKHTRVGERTVQYVLPLVVTLFSTGLVAGALIASWRWRWAWLIGAPIAVVGILGALAGVLIFLVGRIGGFENINCPKCKGRRCVWLKRPNLIGCQNCGVFTRPEAVDAV